ncbi:MAG: hypothetical protein JJ958_04705 [Balneola sp.]|jgi:hypothetical protein|nr:hypothetical protein [Balneola sp.]
MKLIKQISFILILISIFSSCSRLTDSSEEQLQLLKVASELFIDDKEVLFQNTFDKKTVNQVLGSPLSKELLIRNPVSTEVDIDSLFDESTLKQLNQTLKDYKSINLQTLNINSVELVNDKQIPDYVRDQRPVPIWEAEFTSVLYLSTPLVYKNRAIVLSDKSGDGLIGINFFIKENKNWVMVGSTF